jgi:hypothetical protein
VRRLSSFGRVGCPWHICGPLREWMANYEQVMKELLDQMDVYLNELQGRERVSA